MAGLVRRGERCGGCPYLGGTIGYASTRGEARHGVVIVLEALGAEEVLQQQPAVGPTGKLLNRMISRLRDPETGKTFDPSEFLITNTVWCRPFEMTPGGIKNRTPTWDEMHHCQREYLLPLLREVQPRVILAAGAVPMEALTGHTNIRKMRGYQVKALQKGITAPVIPTYHPAYLMKGKLSLCRVWQMDLRKALELAREGSLPEVERHYLEDPPVPEFNQWVTEALKSPPAFVSFDIETPNAGAMKDELIDPEELRLEDDSSYIIFRISFSIRPHEAVSVPWSPAYLPGISAMLENDHSKVVWNRFFDVPRVEFNGVKVGGRVYDGMDMWHFAEPGFPMGLKYASTFVCPDMPPWHLEKDARPAWYNAADSDAALRVVHWCEDRLRREGRWDVFERHFVDLGRVLQQMSLRGIPVDPARRAEKREYFAGLFDEDVAVLQPLVPDEVKPLRKPPYKKTEKQLKDAGLWMEGRMVPVPITRRETAADIPEGERCDRKGCAHRWAWKTDGQQRCEKHVTKKMRAAECVERREPPS